MKPCFTLAAVVPCPDAKNRRRRKIEKKQDVHQHPSKPGPFPRWDPRNCCSDTTASVFRGRDTRFGWRKDENGHWWWSMVERILKLSSVVTKRSQPEQHNQSNVEGHYNRISCCIGQVFSVIFASVGRVSTWRLLSSGALLKNFPASSPTCTAVPPGAEPPCSYEEWYMSHFEYLGSSMVTCSMTSSQWYGGTNVIVVIMSMSAPQSQRPDTMTPVKPYIMGSNFINCLVAVKTRLKRTRWTCWNREPVGYDFSKWLLFHPIQCIQKWLEAYINQETHCSHSQLENIVVGPAEYAERTRQA